MRQGALTHLWLTCIDASHQYSIAIKNHKLWDHQLIFKQTCVRVRDYESVRPPTQIIPGTGIPAGADVPLTSGGAVPDLENQ